MTKQVFDRVKVVTATTGTGNITLGAAVNGFQTWAAAGAADGDNIAYVIEDGYAWEIGWGVLGGTGTVLTRNVISSSNAGAALNLSGNAIIYSALIKSEYDNKVEKTGATMTGDLTISKTNPMLFLDGDSNSYYPNIQFGGASFAAGTYAYIQGYQGLYFNIPDGKGYNFVEGGQSVLSMQAGSVTFGPSSGAATDDAVYFDCTNYYHFWTFRRWAAGVPTTQAQLQVADAGFYWGANAHTFRSVGGTVYGTVTSSGIDISGSGWFGTGARVQIYDDVNAGYIQSYNLKPLKLNASGNDVILPGATFGFTSGVVTVSGVANFTGGIQVSGAALNAANGLLKLDSGGRITTGQLPTNVPTVGLADGGMEIGQYLDFHSPNLGDGQDYRARLQVNASNYLSITASGGLSYEGQNLWLNAQSLLVQHDGSNGYVRTGSAKGHLYLGANGANVLAVGSGGNVTLQQNGKGYGWMDASGTSPLLTCQTDNNLVFYSTDATGASRAIWSVFARSNSATFNINPDTILAAGGSTAYVRGTSFLKLMHDGSNAYIQPGTGMLVLGAGGNNSIWINADGTVTSGYQWNFTTTQTFTAGGNQLILKNGTGSNPSLIFRNDGTNFYLLKTAASTAPNGAWDTTRPLTINMTTGDISMSENVNMSKTLTVSNTITTNGTNGGLQLTTRDTGANWTLYNSGGTCRLWNGADRFTVDANGNLGGRDHYADRGDGTGVIYFGNPGNSHYLYWDNTWYHFNNGAVHVNGQIQCDSTLTVLGMSVFNTPNSGTSGGIQLRANGTTGNAYFQVTDSGGTTQWGLATVTSAGKFTWSGDIVAFSDGRLKENIETVEGALDKVCRMRGVTFTWKSNGVKSAGVIAQEHMEVAPEAVSHDPENDIYGVNDAATTAYLIEAIKELKALVDAQAREIAELKRDAA